tara:strand:- start:15 stop:203 length:189 start_codon:yes stop_codon:yes gene_type:complete
MYPVYKVIIVEIAKNKSEIIRRSMLLIASANKYKLIVNICVVVLNFARKVTFVAEVLLFLEL